MYKLLDSSVGRESEVEVECLRVLSKKLGCFQVLRGGFVVRFGVFPSVVLQFHV